MPSNYWSNHIIWITGASTGIGRALAKDFLSLGATVIGSARDNTSLRQVSDNHRYLPLPVDITDNTSLRKIANQIETQFGRLDMLIANAGICEYIDMSNFDIQIMEKVMYVNYIGSIRTINVALPLLRKAKHPYLLCMSSSNAYLGLPSSEAYGPSKSAIYNLMQSMKADLTGEIDVSVICPGFVKSPLTDLNDFPMPMLITAEQASKYILKGIKRRTFDIHFPKRFTLLMRVLSCLPDRILFKLTQQLSRRKS